MSISILPDEKSFKINDRLFLLFKESESTLDIVALGNLILRISYIFSVPCPFKTILSDF